VSDTIPALLTLLFILICIGLYVKLLRSNYINQLGVLARWVVYWIGCVLFGLTLAVLGIFRVFSEEAIPWIGGTVAVLVGIIAIPWIEAPASKK
jgi:hypothetical protein